jgi:hypothetical protein
MVDLRAIAAASHVPGEARNIVSLVALEIRDERLGVSDRPAIAKPTAGSQVSA